MPETTFSSLPFSCSEKSLLEQVYLILMIMSHLQVRQKQLNIDQLQYQLTTEHRRAEEEINALKMRNSDLSLQVTQARHEADEFYKTGLERNIDAVALGNQVSFFCEELLTNI